MPPKFGTSGLRGLVEELTDDLCARHTRGFLQSTGHDGLLVVGGDLRPSTPRLVKAVARGAASLGVRVVDCGELPTPALAIAAMKRRAPAIMVTGSHIPADRNGLKFYTRAGEITKEQELAIIGALEPTFEGGPEPEIARDTEASEEYARRYVDYFGSNALAGLRVGVYEHSSVGRDILTDVLARLGAEPISFGRSDSFVPVDTEAVSPETREALAHWASAQALDAIVSTDGDADRPLVADAAGKVIPGDVLGPLTARRLGAETVVTPVSSNTLVEAMGGFDVHRTRIGSPHVIAGMMKAASDGAARVVGFEANGGFLLGFDAPGAAATLLALMTRDCLLPILAPLAEAADMRCALSELVAALPPRHTAADRLKGVSTDASQALVAELSEKPGARAKFFGAYGSEAGLDLTDGLRITFTSGLVVHLRPSGNAPELRCYAEAQDVTEAERVVAETLAIISMRIQGVSGER